jgi:hypothetical protein
VDNPRRPPTQKRPPGRSRTDGLPRVVIYRKRTFERVLVWGFVILLVIGYVLSQQR